ncbi:GGDEF domain-containing protein [Aeromicrobium sp. SORGH_AS981]|uniref:GOLPH3/VPS74 family protein n=1 Tax=Aeromicrobium sp. SORGH_AS_0981 TaxID=3041802 RepID=UPI00285BF130|nr:GPP34 family phosphoprotein [Aeromicrobium sp. SORGH_AS_0981]MDR6118038.1 GGDEF domain-containing protein [Aeromicrobium sp. SORGH_AS_0981]
MTVAKNLFLVAIDPRTGRVRVVTRTVEAALGGAALIDLVLLGRLRLEGSGRKARVEVVDRTPVSDPALQTAFERVREQGRQTPKSTIARLGRRQRAVVLRDMEAAGTVRRQRRLVLERYDVADVVQRDDLVGRLRAVLLQEQPADETTGPLVGLLLATGHLGIAVTDRRELKVAKERAKVVAEGDWASEGVRGVLQDAQNAMTAVLTTGAVLSAINP